MLQTMTDFSAKIDSLLKLTDTDQLQRLQMLLLFNFPKKIKKFCNILNKMHPEIHQLQCRTLVSHTNIDILC